MTGLVYIVFGIVLALLGGILAATLGGIGGSKAWVAGLGFGLPLVIVGVVLVVVGIKEMRG